MEDGTRTEKGRSREITVREVAGLARRNIEHIYVAYRLMLKIFIFSTCYYVDQIKPVDPGYCPRLQAYTLSE